MIFEVDHVIAQAVADNIEVLAIGVIHGEAALLDTLLARAEALPRRGRRVLVFTGDLIDRGPQSRKALLLAASAGDRVGADETVALMGNHEQMLLCALMGMPARRLNAYALWIANGGHALLHEVFGANWERLHDLDGLREAMSDSIAFLRSMRPHWRSGDVLFVHAGLSPTVPPETFLATPWDVEFRTLCEARHWAWIRAPFLEAESHGGLFVVHGHTPPDNVRRVGAAMVAHDRLNLDLGSSHTGMARMARFVGREVTVFDATSDS